MTDKILPEPVVAALFSTCDGFRRDAEPLLREYSSIYDKAGTRSDADKARMREIQLSVSGLALEAMTRNPFVDLASGAEIGGMLDVDEGAHPESVIELEQVYHNQQLATARAKMFFTPWSEDFLHGADILLPVAKLAEKLLTADETITTLSKITWTKPAKNNLSVAVTVGGFSGHDLSQYCFYGEFLTSDGRTLAFFGIDEVGDPVTKTMPGTNPFANGVICGDPNHITCQGDLYKMELHKSLTDRAIACLDQNPALKIGTLVDIITHGVARLSMETGALEGSKLRLMGGVSGLKIPASYAQLFTPDAVLEMRLVMDKAKPGKSGFRLIPFEFRLPHQTEFGTGILAETESKKLAETHCG